MEAAAAARTLRLCLAGEEATKGSHRSCANIAKCGGAKADSPTPEATRSRAVSEKNCGGLLRVCFGGHAQNRIVLTAKNREFACFFIPRIRASPPVYGKFI
jgi:hypothetical protein